MVLFSCRASPFRRWAFRMTATLLFSTSMLLLCVFISLEVFGFITLQGAELIPLLDAHMPIIDRKSIAVAAMGFVVLFIQTWSVNTVRGQEVARLRAGLNTSTEKIMVMCVPVVVLLFADVLCIVYAKELKRALATGLLLMIKDYDANSWAQDVVDHLQNLYSCCGVNNAEDYEDLSRVDLYGSPNPFPREKTLQSCPQSDLACLYPITCCASVECTEYRLAALNIEGDRFHERWYKSRGCVDALFAAHFSLLDPQISIWLISVALICEAAALVFAQLTLTSYLTLSESGLSDADESMAWLLPFTYPSPDDVVQWLSEWAGELYGEKGAEDEEEDGGNEGAVKRKQRIRNPSPNPRAAGSLPNAAQLSRVPGK